MLCYIVNRNREARFIIPHIRSLSEKKQKIIKNFCFYKKMLHATVKSML